MLSRPLAFAVLAAGCMAAAAGGAYVAMRQDAAEMLPVATAATPAASEMLPEGAAVPAGAAAPEVVTAQKGAVDGERHLEHDADLRASERRSAATESARRRGTARSSAGRARSARREAPVKDTPASLPAPIEPLRLPVGNPAPEPQPQLTEIVVPAETVIGVQVNTTVSSERARIEDPVEGRVTRDVTVGDRVAIPAGARLLGSVTLVERGGKFRERARIAVRFHTAVLHDGSRVPLSTTAIMREGESPARESAAKVGGSAVGGAIIGAILGGAKGAVLGGTAGAGAGGAIVAAGDRNPATLPAGTQVSIRLISDVAITVER